MVGNRSSRWLERHWTGLALLAATLMLAAPLWCVNAPAMPDYPAHLASFYLIGGGDGGKAYYIHWTFVPNLASELIIPLLAPLTGLAMAARLFLTAAIALWVMGAGAVHRALYGRTGIAPLFGTFFAYNANFMWGFFNYYFAAGLSLAIFAAWIANARSAGRDSSWRLAGFTLAITILYFCHIFAAATLLMMLAAFETQNLRREGFAALAKRALRVAILYIPAALAFMLLKPHSSGDSHMAFNLLDTMQERYESLIQHDFDSPDYILPVLLFGGLGLAIWRGKARIHPSLYLVLAVLLAASLLAPEWALGGWAVHLRLPALFAMMVFAATELPGQPRLRHRLAALALAAIAASALYLAYVWRDYDRQFTEFRAALGNVPRNARLMTVLDGDAIGLRADQPYWHLAEFAIIDRAAFTPLMFTTRGQHMVQLRPPYERIAAVTAQQGSPPDVDELDFLSRGRFDQDEDMRESLPYLAYFQCHFDQAVVVHLDGKRTPLPAMLHLRHAGSFFSLYDIKPDAACPHA